jgi:hypothetical protein
MKTKLIIPVLFCTGCSVSTLVWAQSSQTQPCQVYALQDHGRNNSQLYTVAPETFEVNTLSQIYPKHDLEALAAEPQTDQLYLASGNDSVQPGYLYRFNLQSRELTEIGDTGFGDVTGLGFHPDGTLWGAVKGQGLITIETETGQGTLVKAFPGVKVEGITWNNAGTLLYAIEKRRLWVYEQGTESVERLCVLGAETESLEILPDDTLLVGSLEKGNVFEFQAIDVNFETGECEKVFGTNMPTSSQLNDVEGVAWPLNACSQP